MKSMKIHFFDSRGRYESSRGDGGHQRQAKQPYANRSLAQVVPMKRQRPEIPRCQSSRANWTNTTVLDEENSAVETAEQERKNTHCIADGDDDSDC